MAQLNDLLVLGDTNLQGDVVSQGNVTAPKFVGALQGNADTATALTSNAGSATTPVYFTNGKPTACTYSLAKSVPADAKFTDTVYTLPAATSSALGGVKVGSNITVSSGTISLTKDNVTSALGYTPPTSNTTYNVVTNAANGLVPKFDGADGTIDSSSNDWVLTNNNGAIGWYKLPANAFKNDNTVYTHPAGNAASKSSGLYKFSTDSTSHINSVAAATKSDIINLGISDTGYGTCTTAESTVAKTATLNNYVLAAGNVISIKFDYAVPANATLNINSTGAKSIYYKDKAIINGIICTGEIATFIYDGTKYHLISLDRNRFYSTLVPYGTKIDASESNKIDLNTVNYLKVGNYYCASNAIAKHISNLPLADTAFMMCVYSPLSSSVDDENGTWRYRLRKLNTYTGYEFVQYCYSDGTAGNWHYGSWEKVIKSSDTFVKSGTGAKAGLVPAPSTTAGTTKYLREDGTWQVPPDTKYTLPTASSSNLGGVKIGSNINISSGVISVPTADKDTAGVTVVYPAASCTSFSSDSGTITPLAAQKSAELFAITRPPKRSSGNPANPGAAGTCTTNNIVRWLNAAGDVQDSKITIEDVTNTKDTTKKAQVISIPAEGGKKMVYGYCTDQVDGTSFIGGIFDANATEYPYAQGLAIGGTSGNLLWKGKAVVTTDQSLKNPYAITIQGNGTTLTNGVYDGSAAKTVNITASSIGAAPTSHASTATTYGAGTGSNYGHVKLSDSTSSTSAASSGVAASPKAVKTVYDAAAKLASANTFSAKNTFTGTLCLGSSNYGASLPSSTTAGQLYFVEDNSPSLPSGGATNQILVSDASGNAKWHSVAKSTDTSKRYLVNTGSASGLDYVESVYTQDNVLFGAAWNDYAEFRAQKEIIEPGYCVASNDNGQVYKTTEKYQACDGIVSDTYGFAIGETKESNTPLAVAGRVLAYFEGNREDYHAGDTVCAGPNGKVCKMTREEIREWPDRIIGIVSEIPHYDTWGENNIKVNNRIWIKIK